METHSIKQISLNGSPAYILRYQLSYAEAYDAFYVLADKFGKQARAIAIAVVAITVAGLLFMQYRIPQALYYTVVAGWGILVLFWLVYAPPIKARRGAKSVCRAGGAFAFTLCETGYILMGGTNTSEQSIALAGDKNSRIIETDQLFVIRPDHCHSFCIPKRILIPSLEEQVRALLNGQVACYQRR